MINVAQKSDKTKNIPILKFTTLSLTSLLTLFKEFVKLEFKSLSSCISYTSLIEHSDKFTFKIH
jgi:hypothetical protein